MLVITRYPGQTFTVGEATILIESIRGDKVRIGIEAPRHIQVRRDDAGPYKGDAEKEDDRGE